MSALEGRPQQASSTHHEARVHQIERVLHTYGVLTRPRLYELSGADRWTSEEEFADLLGEAVRAGRVRPLGGVLYEATGD